MKNEVENKTSDLLRLPRVGDIVEGSVIGLGRSAVYVDLGPTGTGIIFGQEFYDARDVLRNVKVGEKLMLKVVDLENDEGYLELSASQAGRELNWEKLLIKKEKDEATTAKVLGANKGGLLVEAEKVQGFLPVSQLSPKNYPRVEGADKTKILAKLQDLIGQELTVKILTIDPRKEIHWVLGKTLPATMEIFVEGKADAFLAFAPQPQDLRARKIGHVIVDTTYDRPWSQYFCCVLTANREFATKHPIATKRALRAILKAADICAQEPERAARYLVARGYESRYETALEILKTLPYARWREVDPADTLRFHALRLHEVGMIKSTPQKIIAQGTDWRFLNELKKELKA